MIFRGLPEAPGDSSRSCNDRCRAERPAGRGRPAGLGDVVAYVLHGRPQLPGDAAHRLTLPPPFVEHAVAVWDELAPCPRLSSKRVRPDG